MPHIITCIFNKMISFCSNLVYNDRYYYVFGILVMPSYPLDFYTNKPSDKIKLAFDGDLIDTNALLDGQEKVYYSSESFGEVLVPKVLILNDFTLQTNQELRLFNTKTVLADLLQNHFKIYYHKNGHWISLEQSLLDSQLKDYRQYVIASDNDALCHAAVRPLKTSLTNLLCLDYYKLNALIDPTAATSNVINPTDNKTVYRSDLGTAQIKPEIEPFVMNDMLERLQDAPLVVRYLNASALSNNTLSQENLALMRANTTMVDVKEREGVASFQEVFSQQNNMQQLKINTYVSPETIQLIDYSNLKLLSYTSALPRSNEEKVFRDNFKHIINTAAHLSKLHCYIRTAGQAHLEFWAKDIKFEFGGSELQSFDLSFTNLRLSQVIGILNQQPKLESMSFIPYFDAGNAAEHMPQGSYRSLKRLQLNEPVIPEDKKLTVSQCLEFLSRFPNLQDLSVSELKLKPDSTGYDKPMALQKLQSIDFHITREEQSTKDWVAPFFIQLLSMAPYVESIRYWPGLVLPATLSLPRLKQLSWFRGSLTLEALQTLAVAAPNLESLTIVSARSGDQLDDIQRIASFPKLKEIDVFYNRINQTILKAIIENTPSLERVRIRMSETPDWLATMCKERNIQLLETAFEQRGSDVQALSTNETVDSEQIAFDLQSIRAKNNEQTTYKWMDRYFQGAFHHQPNTVAQYLASLVGGGESQQLIELDSRDAVNDLMIHLEQYCHESGHPVYFANTPKDLRCASRYIEKIPNTNTGRMVNERKGAMMEFINTLPANRKRPIFVVNKDEFEDGDSVKLNTVFDPPHLRHADGVKYPEDAIVLVLNSKEAKTEPAFLSRFKPKNRTKCPFSQEELNESLPRIEPAPLSSSNQPYVIDFFGLGDWKQRLEGHWVMGERWTWKPGILEDIQRQSIHSVVLRNAPVDDPNFQWYWERVCRQYHITQTQCGAGYDWNSLNTVCVDESKASSTVVAILNPKYLSKFFWHYEPSESTMNYVPGLIEQYKDQTITVYETSPISLGNKARLYEECKKHHVLLEIKPGSFSFQQQSNVSLIQSTDVDFVLDELSERHQDAIVIDISEINVVQLFGKSTPIYDETTGSYRFETSESWLLNQLNNGQKVILKGRFSQVLRDHLAPYLLLNQPWSGNLVLLSSVDEHWDSYQNLQTRTVSLADKKQRLLQKYLDKTELVEQLLKDCPLEQSYIHLDKRMRYLLRNQNKIIDNSSLYDVSTDNWAGLLSLGHDNVYQEEDLDQTRKDAIDNILKDESIVIIVGKTGVGKTESITRFYDSKQRFSENELLQWLEAGNNDDGTPVYLLMDEANITDRTYMEYSRLPEGIFIGDKYYAFTPQQKKNNKIIAMVNPYSYGGGRSIPALFVREGNTCIFDPFPANYIQKKILSPLFEGTGIEPTDIEASILNAYNFLLGLPSYSVLVTPRELSMMALLTISTCQQYPDVPVRDVADFFVYHLTQSIAYTNHAFSFDKMFPNKPNWSPELEHNVQSPDFCLTESRQLTLQFLEAFLRVREFKQQPNRNKDQLVSGLTTMTLQGLPAQGKSVLLDALFSNNPDVITIPASTDYDETQRLLLDAFDRGQIVRVDEGNVLNVSEKFLNSLQSGYHPIENRLAKKPGFIFATSENSYDMGGGRRVRTNAQERRTFCLELKPYSFDELKQIAHHHGLGLTSCDYFVKRYQAVVRQQQARGDTAWTVREMIDRIQEIRKDSQRVIDNSLKFFIQKKRKAPGSLITVAPSPQEMPRQSPQQDAYSPLVSPEQEHSTVTQDTTTNPVNQPVSFDSAWFIHFLPELIGGAMITAGIGLLVTGLLTTAVAPIVGGACIVAGLALIVASLVIRSCVNHLHEDDKRLDITAQPN